MASASRVPCSEGYRFMCFILILVCLEICLKTCVALRLALLPGEFAPIDPTATPTVLIIGAAKGGTTDLHAQLTEPSLANDPERPDPPLIGGIVKELALLHKVNLAQANFTPYALTFRQYLGGLHHPCAGRSKAQLRDCLLSAGAGGPSKINYTIDATPDYCNSPATPLLLRSFSPNSKVIMMLREPTDRVEALYHHWVVKNGLWPTTTVDQLATAFLRYLDSNRDAQATLRRLANCTTTAASVAAAASGSRYGRTSRARSSMGLDPVLRCQEAGWQDLAAMNMLANLDFRLFVSGMYTYALAAWRLHYFQPGRVMIVDGHMYFRNREAVMAQVIAFLYGRDMTAAEHALARHATAKNVKNRHTAITANDMQELPAWMLSNENREKLQKLYHTHVLRGLPQMLQELRVEGAWLLGFARQPWPWGKEVPQR